VPDSHPITGRDRERKGKNVSFLPAIPRGKRVPASPDQEKVRKERKIDAGHLSSFSWEGRKKATLLRIGVKKGNHKKNLSSPALPISWTKGKGKGKEACGLIAASRGAKKGDSQKKKRQFGRKLQAAQGEKKKRKEDYVRLRHRRTPCESEEEKAPIRIT